MFKSFLLLIVMLPISYGVRDEENGNGNIYLVGPTKKILTESVQDLI